MTTPIPQHSVGALAWGQTWPPLPEFRELAVDRRVIPVVRRLLADDLTPVALYRRLAAGRPGTFIMESAEIDGSWSRYSFVGVRSRATLTVVGDEAVWRGDVPAGVPTAGPPLEVLASTLRVLHTEAIDGLPRSPAAWSAPSAGTSCGAGNRASGVRPRTSWASRR